jgi:DNA polymerase-3 subunit chi
MPAEWWFYQVEHTSLDAAVGPLLEKCLERKWRVVVTAKPGTIERLDAALWTWKDDSFLPHGRGGAHPERQPILLTTEAEPQNGAKIVVLLDGLDADAARFDRCLVVFDGGDEPVRAKARAQFKAAADSGATAKYFQQEHGGKWVDKTPPKREAAARQAVPDKPSGKKIPQ